MGGFVTDLTLSKLVVWKKTILLGGVVYIDLHSPASAVRAGGDFSMNSKDNW